MPSTIIVTAVIYEERGIFYSTTSKPATSASFYGHTEESLIPKEQGKEFMLEYMNKRIMQTIKL